MKRRLTLPLFWRIFLLIWIAMAVAVVASNMALHELSRRERVQLEQRDDLAQVARQAAELKASGDRRGARDILHRIGERESLYLILVDSDEQENTKPGRFGKHLRHGFPPQRPAVIDAPAGYRMMIWQRGDSSGWLGPRMLRSFEMAMTFLMITLACWWIARHISRPLRKVEATAQAIAVGDMSLRVDDAVANRRDEIGALASAFNAMTDRLCTLLSRQQQLLRDISHDLRTPLARQRVAIELAGDAGHDADLMATILRQNERIEAMTSQILTLYRLSEKGQAIAREPVRFVRVLNDVLQGAADYAEQRSVDCQLTMDEDARKATVLGDSGLIYRALDNVLQNALDHTLPEHKVHLNLTVEAHSLVCTIRDEGPGVASEDLVNLFEPFFRSDQARGGQGWGLGLAISRDIMQAHDGQIDAVNSDMGGLEVRLSWPLFV
ncbi:sensor histidine kinase [Marinobacter sp. V034]|uniref:sensor histidine kinase n=1 Tax=Marinobacter sp. V034 TaxID=3459610 RepID=UPI004044D1B5